MKSHCCTYYARMVRIETQPLDDCSKTSENHRKLQDFEVTGRDYPDTI